MKKIFVLLGLFIITNHLASQPLVQENKVWNVIECLNFGGCYTESFKLSGDTSMGDLSYKKLYRTLDTTLNEWYLWGAMREMQGRVFHSDFENETLLYDFNLSVADTFRTTVIEPPECPIELVVSSIDTVEIENGDVRQRTNFNSGEQWIKGIGSLNGLIYVGVHQCIIDQYYGLSCVHLEDELIFNNPDFEYCYVNTVGIVEENTVSGFSVYPNPFHTSTNITYSLQQASSIQITFYNYLGKQIDYIRKEQAQGKQQFVWHAERFPAGVYYFILQAGKQVSTGKMLKTK
ncbi:MAG: T9SS type A sorting domain-containing protein [Bacteroidales bacterium]|nr:T9SS type A sorting domain-containing protein [Bacteroidales bacterium]